MSAEKQKVYQGVRVKITVKELLQQRRALQAATITTTASPCRSSKLHEGGASIPPEHNSGVRGSVGNLSSSNPQTGTSDSRPCPLLSTPREELQNPLKKCMETHEASSVPDQKIERTRVLSDSKHHLYVNHRRNHARAPQYAGAPPNGCESSFHESSQFPENVSHGQHPTLYDEVYETCLSDLCTESSYTSSFCSPPVSYQTPALCSHSAVISGSPAYASMDYEYSTQHVALSPQDFCPSSHLETKSFYPTSEEYFAHQHYSCTSAICSIFSYMPDNMEMGSVSENGSFTIPEYKDYTTGLLTDDIWRGNLNECLDY